MNNEEEEYDGEKTQFWLPGGGSPGAPLKPADNDNKGTVIKPAKAANRSKTETSTVDFDITSGGSEANTATGTVDFDITSGDINSDTKPADSAEKKAAAAAALAARTRSAVAEKSASSGSSFGTIVVVLIVAAIAYFLFR